MRRRPGGRVAGTVVRCSLALRFLLGSLGGALLRVSPNGLLGGNSGGILRRDPCSRILGEPGGCRRDETFFLDALNLSNRVTPRGGRQRAGPCAGPTG